MSRTLYIDVDGVICPFGPAGTTGWGTAWRRADAGLLPVAYAAELVTGLNSIAAHQGVRCVWLTSWEELAPRYLCRAIGLDGRDWPYLTAAGAGTGRGGGAPGDSWTTWKPPVRMLPCGSMTSSATRRRRIHGCGCSGRRMLPYPRIPGTESRHPNWSPSGLSLPDRCFDLLPRARTIDRVSHRFG